METNEKKTSPEQNRRIEEVLSRGVEEVIVKDDLQKQLESGKTLRVKFGIDPTSPDLHLGHSIPLRKLKQFQDLGHKVILLIGDFTATIGDPSGRATQRQQLDEKEVKKNMKDYLRQAGKILNIRKTEVRYNGEWYKKKGAYFLMELTSKITYARATERDDFQKRMKEGSDINMLEILYPILQGYDSVELKSDVEIGGKDQKFNLLMGRKIQKRYDMSEQDVVMLPLLEGTDGTQKMSKSYGNYISISEEPSQMYGKLMTIPDSLILKYVELLTDLSIEEVKNIPNPRNQKAMLAKEIVKMYHGEKEAQKAEEDFNKTFRDKKPTFKEFKPEKYEEFYPKVIDDGLVIVAGANSSVSAAKRLIQQGAVEINGVVDKDWKKSINLKIGDEIKVGERVFIKIK